MKPKLEQAARAALDEIDRELAYRERRRLTAELLKALVMATGGQTKLAKMIGTTQATVSRLVSGEFDVSAETAINIEAQLGVPVEKLRPDLPWHVLRKGSAKAVRDSTHKQRKTAGA